VESRETFEFEDFILRVTELAPPGILKKKKGPGVF
jgi:hypothetical protein